MPFLRAPRAGSSLRAVHRILRDGLRAPRRLVQERCGSVPGSGLRLSACPAPVIPPRGRRFDNLAAAVPSSARFRNALTVHKAVVDVARLPAGPHLYSGPPVALLLARSIEREGAFRESKGERAAVATR